MNDKISVVIITCNRQEIILKCIDSCLKHTRCDIEFVIVDNASTDNTEVIVRQYLSSISRATLNYVKLDKNTGVSYARNVGYREANCEILFFIDDDAEVISDGMSLDIVSDYMRANEDVASCTGKSLDYRYGGEMHFIKDKTDKKEDYYQVRSYVGFNHFIKKGFSGKDYIYPDNLFYGSEELFVALTVASLGKKVININSHIVEHHPSPSMRLNRHEGLKNGHINTFVIKNYFCPSLFKPLSYILFLLRICRFSKFNISEINECLLKARQRYNKKYRQPMSVNMSVDCIRKFGLTKIL